MHTYLKGTLSAFLYLTMMVCASGCSNNHDHSHTHNHEEHDHAAEKHEHEHEEGGDDHSNLVFFSKAQSEKVEFETKKATVQPFGEVIRTMAFVEPSAGDERIVAAKASGIIHINGDRMVDGRNVKAGESLFTIDGTAMADNNLSVRLKEAESAYQLAKSEYERKELLLKDKLVTEGDYRKAKADYEQAAASYEALRKGFSGGSSGGVAPISGFIKKVYVRNGEYVEAGAPVAAIAQNRNLYIRAEISPRKSAGLRNVTGATIKNPTDGEVYALSDLNGSPISVGKGADIENPLIPVIFEVSNTVDLVPGTFVEMFITAGEEQALTVPVSALIEEMDNYFVYVEKMPEHYEKREVKIGKNNGKVTQIVSGLKEGETVVSKGAILVKLAQGSGKLDAHAGHVH